MSLFNLNNLLAPLTPEEILKRVSSELLWARYAGRYLNQKFHVPPFLRNGVKDTNPSGSLFIAADGEVLLYDHAYHTTFNIFVYLRKAYPSKNFNEILQMINKDFKLGIGTLESTSLRKLDHEMVITKDLSLKTIKKEGEEIKFSTNKVIKIEPFIRKEYSKELLEYFKPLSEDTLRFFEVIEITGYELYDKDTTQCTVQLYNKQTYNTIPPEIAFAYPNYEWRYIDSLGDFKNMPASYKICMPDKDRQRKWINNSTKYCIDGLKQLLIYESLYNDSSSYKDIHYSVSTGLSIPDAMYSSIRDYPLCKNLISQLATINSSHMPAFFDVCIITKSRKDVMAWAELGYAAISLQAEYPKFPYKQVLRYLGEFFNHVIINYDNDPVGLNTGSSLLEDISSNVVEGLLIFPENYKDCFGTLKGEGHQKTQKYVDEAIKKLLNEKRRAT